MGGGGHPRHPARVRLDADPPQAALEDVAVIDVDGTLRRGWTVFGWVQFLADAGYEGSHEALGDLLIRKEKYTRGELSHDELAAECAQRYAVFEAELPRSELKQEARVYAQQSLATDFYEYGPQVIELIRDRSVAPILVTGAPAVVATEYAAGLGVDEVHALECEAGEVRRNWGLAAEKRKLCNELVQNGRVVVVGIGDSTSDRAMLAAAQVRIVMGSKLVTPDDWPSERLLRIDETTEPELVSEWLAQRLEESTL